MSAPVADFWTPVAYSVSRVRSLGLLALIFVSPGTPIGGELARLTFKKLLFCEYLLRFVGNTRCRSRWLWGCIFATPSPPGTTVLDPMGSLFGSLLGPLGSFLAPMDSLLDPWGILWEPLGSLLVP